MSIDLVVLVPDASIEQAVRGLLSRPAAVGIRPLGSVKVLVHPNRDPGVFGTAHTLLESFATDAEFALIILDHAWEGSPHPSASEIAKAIESKCRKDWGDRVRCICIDPEVEVWVWSNSPHVAAILGWNSNAELTAWLRERGLWPDAVSKPPDPKAAFEMATKNKKVVPSSALFFELASKVSFERCQDASFRELLSTLRQWFPPKPQLDDPQVVGGNA